MKVYADKKSTERSFQVGEWILLKLQSYKLTSLKGMLPQKLSLRYYGPYKILAQVRKVAYKLQLSMSVRIHNVFHASQLKEISWGSAST